MSFWTSVKTYFLLFGTLPLVLVGVVIGFLLCPLWAGILFTRGEIAIAVENIEKIVKENDNGK